MLELVTAIAGCLLIVATLVPLLRLQAWWIRIFDFPRMQIASGQVLVLGAWGWQRWMEPGPPDLGQWAAALLLIGCLAEQLRHMLPFTPLARKQVQDSLGQNTDGSIRILFANVLQSNRRSAGLLDIVRRQKPDVFLALETDLWWQAQLHPLLESYPHVVHHPSDNTYGMLLYSRVELIDPKVQFLIREDVPSIHTGLRLASGREVRLHCLHPRPPSPTESDSSSERDAELLIVGRKIKETQAPTIVMGDMNDVAWSHTSQLFRSISGLLDPRIGRGFFNTFNAKHALIRFPLDHFFHSSDFRLVSFRRMESFGSDHFPVFIHLSHEPQAQQAQPEPEPDATQQLEAQEKIDEEPQREAVKP